MRAAHTPGPWTWADVPGAGIQIRGPYEDSTRLLFSDIWRQLPEQKWDAEMLSNAQLATSATDLLGELKNCVDLLNECFPNAPVDSCIGASIVKARAAVAKATGGQS